MTYKITHLTSAHPRYDTRIFIKECCSLAKVEQYQVSLIVADSLGDEIKNNIKIYDVGKIEGRINRIFKTTKKVYDKAIELNSDIYHLHDPELIPMGIKLKKLGKKVIFDAHEDLPKQVMAKHYLNSFSKRVLSKVISKGEIWASKKFDLVIGATPLLRDKFLSFGIYTIDVNNFPILDELMQIQPDFKSSTICYIGLLYESRGIREIVKAIEDLDVKLIIAGRFFDPQFEEEIRALKGWEKVDFRGFVGRAVLKEIFSESIAGLVTLHPTPSYIEAYPVKMFEYMSAGIAVISSDFPIYKNLLQDAGVVVNPLDTEMIKEHISTLLKDKSMAKHMGKRGKELISKRYNWEHEKEKLLSAYSELLHA